MNKRLRLVAISTVCIMIFMSFSGFTYYNGFGTAYYDLSKKIYNGVVYHEQIGIGANGNQHAFFTEADTVNSSVIPMVFNGEVRGTATVGKWAKYAEEQGYKVLAAINGDLYDTSTGTPKGTVIHDGIIVTSGYAPDRVIAFDKEGHGSMQHINLTYGLKGTIAYDDVENLPVVDANGNPTTETTSVPKKVETTFSANIDYFNVPHGAAKGLHLFNRHYGPSTKTSGSCIEVVVDCGSSEGKQVTVGGTIKGTVKAVNVDKCNTPIGENEVVLSTLSGSASASKLYSMVPGSEVYINVNDNNGGLTNVKEAMGIYYSLIENGQIVTSGTGANPRTAVGITSDGKLMLYAVDGRQAASKGLNLVELAQHMQALGCVWAFNMDGGGSTAFYSRLPGMESYATLKNSPSGGNERSVANALIIAYASNTSQSNAENLNVYPAMTLMLPNATQQFSSYASNNNYEKVSLPGSVTYTLSDNNGSIDGSGIYTAGNTDGKVTITASVGNISGETQIEIVTKNLTITPSVSKLTVDAGKTADINMTVKSGPVSVVSEDKCFTWSCDENIGTITQEGIFTAVNANALSGNIYAKFNEYSITIPVTVGRTSIDFSDTMGHWARTYTGSLAARGFADGVGNNMYMPDANITRAQFLALLAKSQEGVDVTKSAPVSFKDVAPNEWYYGYVNWGYENGIVDGMGEGMFAPNANITREQMCIMLCKFAKYQEIALPQVNAGISFKDKNSISYWAAAYVDTVAGAGIVSGMPEGNFQPQGLTTRAQAAKVLYSYIDIRAGIN